MASRHHRCGLFLSLLLAALLPGSSVAEIYQWTDASGRVHFTQDLQKVPPRQRGLAEAKADQKPTDGDRIQYIKPSTTPPPARRSTSSSGASGNAKTYKIRVQRAGSSMRVKVRINGQIDVPFLIDTGATDVVIPAWAAEKLDLELDEARTGYYSTANGTISQKLVVLESVSLGGAEVKNVSASVSDSMKEGLLGLSYFNHFKSNIDPVSGTVTLQRNDLEETGRLRAGHSEGQWKSHFRAARKRIEAKAQQVDDTPFSRARLRERRKLELGELEQEFKKLENEADEARVPFSWRD